MIEKEGQIGRGFPVELIVPESVVTSRTTNIVIQRTRMEEFIVSFFEDRLPIFTGSEEEQFEQFMKLEAIPAICTARFVLDYDKLVEFSNVFKDTIDEFQQKTQKKQGD
jgi:hypothetical protein